MAGCWLGVGASAVLSLSMLCGAVRVAKGGPDAELWAKPATTTWFTWIGGSQPDSAFYYRVQSPVILIEFDHQRPANLRGFASDPDKPTQQHIHCVVRTPNGNDYGKDLLRQHYLAHPHTA